MPAPGWYPDPELAGALRWWDGSGWTEHRAPGAAPSPVTSPPAPATPPPVRVKLRPDGSVRGLSFRAAASVVFASALAMIVAAIVVVPAFVDTISGPRFAVPGARTMELDRGTWVVYELTGRSRSAGNFTFDVDSGVSLRPSDVRVEGPAVAPVRPQSTSVSETITRGNRTYTAAVRFEVAVSGSYRVSIGGEPSGVGEVIVARPISDAFSTWPWMVAFALASVIGVVFLVLGLLGAANRRAARRAGIVSA